MKEKRIVELDGVKFQAPAACMKAWTEKAEDGTEIRKIRMIASGTKTDAYRDRMSENAITDMVGGVDGKDFLPSHYSEWDEVLGPLMNGKRDADNQFWCDAELRPMTDTAKEKADALYSIVSSGKSIGVSIAGWIKRVMWEEDENDRMIRVIDSIELDHIAATRTPAYRDAHISGIAKSMQNDMLPYLIRSLDEAGVKPEVKAEPSVDPDVLGVVRDAENNEVAVPDGGNPIEAEPQSIQPAVERQEEREQIMTAEEIKALLDAQSESVGKSIAAALGPVAEGMAAILKTTQEANAVAEEAKKVAAAVAEDVKKIGDEPVRTGQATAADNVADPIEDPIMRVLTEAQTPEFKAYAQKNPPAALRHFIEAFSTSDGRNHLFDVMREQGAESNHSGGSGWSIKAA